MKYAVVSSGNKQYKVAEGDVISVEHLSLNDNDTYSFPNVLLMVEDKTRKVGTPYLNGVNVNGTVMGGSVKGPKIRIAKFKAKARHRRVTGFRATTTKIKIDSIK